MGRMRATALLVGVVTLLAGTLPVLAQSGAQGPPIVFPGQSTRDPMGMPGETPQMLARRIRALNTQRQKQMVADANKLLTLALELNAIDKDGIGISPADRMKKLAEIEKLAKRVREKMSFGGWAVPGPPSQFSVLQP